MPAQTGSHVCDVVVAGGSLASAGAAVAASEASNSTRICFLEITDWPGGQASAGGIPAMDFGFQYVNFPQNIPRSLAELLTYKKTNFLCEKQQHFNCDGGSQNSPTMSPFTCRKKRRTDQSKFKVKPSDYKP